MKKVLFVIVGVLFCSLLIVPTAEAKYMHSGDMIILDKEIGSNAFVAGSNITISGTVNGDLLQLVVIFQLQAQLTVMCLQLVVILQLMVM